MIRIDSAIAAIRGGVVIYGVYKRWSLFIDPPWVLRPLFGGFEQAKERRGEKFAVGYLYTIGLGLIVLGLVGVFWWPRN
jgi:hypothetical protein